MHFRSNIIKIDNKDNHYIWRTYHLRNGESYEIEWVNGMKGAIQRYHNGVPGSRMEAEIGYDKHKNIYAITDSFAKNDTHFEFVYTFTQKTVRFEVIESDIINY